MHTKHTQNEKHIIPFFVGLMDGDGSIQVNHWRKKTLQFRWVIKLKSHPQNKTMLTLISQVIGGSVREHHGFLYWSENHQRRFYRFIDLMQKYPPLTKRLQCQLLFFVQALERRDVTWYLAQRGHKYQQQIAMVSFCGIQDQGRVKKPPVDYFASWCSGFIEAEGCFCQRETGWPSFSIAQKNEYTLLENIRDYFSGTNRIRKCHHDLYLWEVYKQSVLQNIITHCTTYPLLGEKAVTLKNFSAKKS